VPLEKPVGGKSYLWFLAAGLGLYCIVLTAITGDIGFTGDDWWVLALPYWNDYPDALVLYAHKFLRPVEGLYWISLFKLVGFNKVAFHFCSLMLLAGSASLMGAALDRAFPARRAFVSMAVLLAFFLPPVSCLTYVLFTDNSRLSMLLFWVSVMAFQRWATRSSSWRGLVLPIAVYVGSFLTYTAPSFLIFLMPLLVWPVHRACSNGSSDGAFLTKLCVGILAAFATAVAVRFVFLSGGAVRTSFLLPPFELLWSYLALHPFYLLAPFTSMSADRWAILLGCLVVLGSVFLFLLPYRGRPEATSTDHLLLGSQWHMVALGGGILVLGMLPYQLAGYGSFSPRLAETLMVKCGALPEGDPSWFNFTWASRIYSSASFGVAILLAFGLSGWRQPSARMIGRIGALVVIGFMAVFHAGLSEDWREAAEIRNDIVRSLVCQVPFVKSDTNLVFLDLACSHKRAEVIRRENGLRELVQMLYADRTLGAWRLYSFKYDPATHQCQQATAMPAGFLSGGGQRQREPAPCNSLLLFKRSGNELALLDKIEAKDSSVPTGIAWRGIEHLASNFDRIQTWSTANSSEARLASTAWRSGLISTLQLTRFRSTLASLWRLKYIALSKTVRRHLLKIRLHGIKVRI
jgi:hypothetical protein